MFKHSSSAAVFATVYLLLYVMFLELGILPNITAVLFFFSPVMLVWLAYTVIRYGHYDGAELKEDQEWGYQDRP